MSPSRASMPYRPSERDTAREPDDGPHRRRGTDAEAAGLGHLAPAAGLRIWAATDDPHPHTVLVAAEAVLAADAQNHRAGEALDRALRTAFWTDSRSISHRAVILDVATEVARSRTTAELDTGSLVAALDDGRHRADLMRDHAIAKTGVIAGSPTFVLPGGYTVTNPGITVYWKGPETARIPIVESYDPSVYGDLLRRAAASAER